MSKTPYQVHERQKRVNAAVSSIGDVIADFIIYKIFRKKPPELKFPISPEILEEMKMATASEWKTISDIRNEAKRKHNNTMRIGLLLCFIYAVISIVFWLSTGIQLVVVFLFITAYMAAKHKLAFNDQFNQTLLPSLLTRLEGFEYKRDGIIPIESVEDSQIIPAHSPRLTRQEDYLRSEQDGVLTELVECELARWKTDSKGNSRKAGVFKGLLLRMELPHRINSRVILHANWGKFLSLMQKKPMDKNQKVQLDIPNPLGKGYDIYAEDPVIAKLVLNAEFLNAYKQFTDQLDVAQAEFSLYEDKCVLLLHRPKDMFSPPPLSGELTQESVLMPILKEIEMVKELTKIARMASG